MFIKYSDVHNHMPYYELSNRSIQDAIAITNKVQFTGDEAFKILELFKALQDDTNKPYYKMEEELAKFFLGKINQTTFIGAHAVFLSKIIISLNKPLKEIPKQPPKPKNIPAPPKPMPKAPPKPKPPKDQIIKESESAPKAPLEPKPPKGQIKESESEDNIPGLATRILT